MKLVGNQAAIGALIAVGLVLGASADVSNRSAMAFGNSQTETRESMVILRQGFAAAFQASSEKVLSAGLDLAGDIAARLKQF